MRVSRRFIQLTVLFIISLGLLTACNLQAKTLNGAQREAVLAFSEPMADKLLAGLKAGDYAAFSADFDTEMRKAITEDNFSELVNDLNAKIGAYLSRQVVSVSEIQGHYVVAYTAKFEKEEEVMVRLVFRVEAPHQVSGLWFDSEKLRQK